MKIMINHIRFCFKDDFKWDAYPSLDHALFIAAEVLYIGEPDFRIMPPDPSFLVDEYDV